MALSGEKADHLPKSEFEFWLVDMPTAEPPNGWFVGEEEMGMGSDGIVGCCTDDGVAMGGVLDSMAEDKSRGIWWMCRVWLG